MPHRNGSSSGGFRPKPKATATLKFTDGDYEGAVVVCALSASVDLYLELSSGATGAGAMGSLLRRFGKEILLSWNVEDDEGQPIPATGSGMCSVDLDFAQAVLSAWLDAKVGVPGPLVTESNSGDTSPGESTKTVSA